MKNVDSTPDAELAEVVAKWQAAVDDALDGRDRLRGEGDWTAFARDVQPRHRCVAGGLSRRHRDDEHGRLPAVVAGGEITLADVVGVLPFDNTLVDVEMTGAQVIASYEHGKPAIAGMTARGGYKLSDGTPIDRDATYHVLVNDFMYAGGDGFKFNEIRPRRLLHRHRLAAAGDRLDYRAEIVSGESVGRCVG